MTPLFGPYTGVSHRAPHGKVPHLYTPHTHTLSIAPCYPMPHKASARMAKLWYGLLSIATPTPSTAILRQGQGLNIRSTLTLTRHKTGYATSCLSHHMAACPTYTPVPPFAPPIYGRNVPSSCVCGTRPITPSVEPRGLDGPLGGTLRSLANYILVVIGVLYRATQRFCRYVVGFRSPRRFGTLETGHGTLPQYSRNKFYKLSHFISSDRLSSPAPSLSANSLCPAMPRRFPHLRFPDIFPDIMSGLCKYWVLSPSPSSLFGQLAGLSPLASTGGSI